MSETTAALVPSTATPPPLAQTVARVAASFFDDVHINVSGLVFFVILGIGIFRPELKDRCNELCALAATYLFASTKAK